MCIKCWKCPPRSAMHSFTLLLVFAAKERFLSCKLPVSRKRFTRRYTVESICLTQENGNVSLKAFWQLSTTEMPASVRQWTPVALVKKTSLHTSTAERQLTDWRERLTTWRDVRGLLKIHSDNVCLLTQSNCTELQPSANFITGCVTLRSLCITS
jgi:hypothetical protein